METGFMPELIKAVHLLGEVDNLTAVSTAGICGWVKDLTIRICFLNPMEVQGITCLPVMAWEVSNGYPALG